VIVIVIDYLFVCLSFVWRDEAKGMETNGKERKGKGIRKILRREELYVSKEILHMRLLICCTMNIRRLKIEIPYPYRYTSTYQEATSTSQLRDKSRNGCNVANAISITPFDCCCCFELSVEFPLFDALDDVVIMV
jgi:hypothetical protein